VDITNNVVWSSDSNTISLDSWGIATSEAAGNANIYGGFVRCYQPGSRINNNSGDKSDHGNLRNYYLGLVYG